MRKKLLLTLTVVCMFFGVSATAYATPGANLIYSETDLGGGTWQYDYTFYNTSDAGEALNSVYFYFTQFTDFTGTSLGTGWQGIAWDGNEWTTDFADTESSGTSYDIAAGSSLSGFTFTTTYKAGNIAYDAFFSGDNFFTGTTSLVPEPISSILFVAGGAVLGFRRFYRKKGSD